ncbi:MAG: hypothetical protein GEV09_26500 [Pseudonocardiaceae bacterium]|nr:hypothetical protein [Pseudonocardiaceae bacterium]
MKTDPGDHRHTATQLLADADRRLADSHAIDAAQVHATLAVAAAVRDASAVLEQLTRTIARGN